MASAVCSHEQMWTRPTSYAPREFDKYVGSASSRQAALHDERQRQMATFPSGAARSIANNRGKINCSDLAVDYRCQNIDSTPEKNKSNGLANADMINGAAGEETRALVRTSLRETRENECKDTSSLFNQNIDRFKGNNNMFHLAGELSSSSFTLSEKSHKRCLSPRELGTRRRRQFKSEKNGI